MTNKIPAILSVKKTYGRNDTNKLLYKCYPYNRELIAINVPYQIKNIGFSKVCIDLYVLLDYKAQRIIETIGPLNLLENFTKYQLYCKNLDFKRLPCINFNSFIVESSISDIVPNRTDWSVFSIDGEDTKDYDDAFSIKKLAEGVLISVYISNIPYLFHELSRSHEDIWSKFMDRVSTIYLPEQIITMLPQNIVSAASLTSGKTSRVLTMDFFIANDKKIKVTFTNSIIKPYKNHVYDSDELKNDKNYQMIFKSLNSYVSNQADSMNLNPVENSHDVVEYLMRLMCFEAGAVLHNNDVGLFRTINEPLEYIYPSNNYTRKIPENMLPYAHITSPIRRIADILNQIKLQEILSYDIITEKATAFYNTWIEKIDYINLTSKNIKRVQNECALLYLYPSICDKEFTGKILAKETLYDVELCIWVYTVFLKEINLISKFNSLEEISTKIERKYKLYSFNNKANFKKKIRLQILDL